MTLGEILALRPPEGADSSIIAAALRRAETRRAELLATAATADQVLSDGLLSADDKAFRGAEQDATLSRRAVERIDALLPRIRLDLESATARETMAALHVQAATVTDLMGAMASWQVKQLPMLAEALRDGLVLHDALIAQHKGLTDAVQAAYLDPAVRELGHFTPDLTARGVPDMARLPRNLFPFTSIT